MSVDKGWAVGCAHYLKGPGVSIPVAPYDVGGRVGVDRRSDHATVRVTVEIDPSSPRPSWTHMKALLAGFHMLYRLPVSQDSKFYGGKTLENFAK